MSKLRRGAFALLFGVLAGPALAWLPGSYRTVQRKHGGDHETAIWCPPGRQRAAEQRHSLAHPQRCGKHHRDQS